MFEVAPVVRKELPESTPQQPKYGRTFQVVFEDDENPISMGPIAHRDTREEAELLADALSKVLTMDAAALKKLLAAAK